MYAGFITSKHTANWLGAHQKFNKCAYMQLMPYINLSKFPALDQIQHFEGYNGPDGIKIKTPHRHEEPSHYYDPKTQTGPLLEHVDNHYQSLIEALSGNNRVRAAFESAWLAHTVVDGLTPAHHYPYEAELHKMYQTSTKQIDKIHQKVLIQGDTRKEMLKNNWSMWGSKGLLSTHIHFEFGVAAAVVTSSFKQEINRTKLRQARKLGALEFFKQEAGHIYSLNIYEEFYKTSWTLNLARTVRRQLAPAIIQTVAIEWILAAEAAGIGK